MSQTTQPADARLELLRLLSKRVRDLDALEWKMGYSLWTILVLTCGAELQWNKRLPLPPAWVIWAVHASALALLYVSQAKLAKDWKEHKEAVLGAGPSGPSWWEWWRTMRWALWWTLETGVTFVLARVASALP